MKKYIGTKTVQATPAVRKGDKIYLPGDEIPKSLDTLPLKSAMNISMVDSRFTP